MKKLLDNNFNCNNEIFTLPTQEGGSEDDNYLASIGDTSLQHLQDLSHSQRQVLEHFIMMKDGNLFRIEPNPFNRDKDSFNLEKEENLEKAFEEKILNNFKGDSIDPEFIATLKKEFKKEVKRRQNSADIFNRQSPVSFEEWKVFQSSGETYTEEYDTDQGNPTPQYLELIPYHEWEKYPQEWKYWDIDSTPNPMFVWCGNAKSYFYDEMPEHHPNKQAIEQYINVFNRDWDDITEEYGKWAISLLANMSLKNEVIGILEEMTEELVEGKDFWSNISLQPNEAIMGALRRLDKQHRTELQQKLRNKKSKDPFHRIFSKNEKEWRISFAKGKSPYKSIKQFGLSLYQHFSKKLKTDHWMRYKELKRKYPPKLIFKEIDLNQASIKEMQSALEITGTEARNIWFARPIDNMGELYDNSFMTISYLTKNKQANKLMYLMNERFAEALKEEDGRILTNFGKVIKKLEIKESLKIPENEWKTIWFYYRILKGKLSYKLRVIQQNENKEKTNV